MNFFDTTGRTAQRGSTIIELLIATMVVALVVTAVAAGMTVSIKNQAEAHYREVATTLGQDALDVFRKERGLLGFANFRGSLINNQRYCVPSNALDLGDLTLGAPCPKNIDVSGQDFAREAHVTFAPGIVRVVVTVSWFKTNSSDRTVELIQEFTEWN